MDERENYTDAGFSRLIREFIDNSFGEIEGGAKLLDGYNNHIKKLVDMLPKSKLAYEAFALGFMATGGLYPTKVSRVYFLLAVQCFLEVQQRGVQILPEELADYMEKRNFPKPAELRKEYEPRKILSQDEALRVCMAEKKVGKKIGLAHGHFRLLTPNHLVFLILASKECDSLYLGVERGARTERYKGKRILFTDPEREEIFDLALRELPIIPFWIDENTEYSDKGYTSLVRDFAPHVYIGQAKDTEKHIRSMKSRIDHMPFSKFVELPLVESLHTSHLEELIFQKE